MNGLLADNNVTGQVVALVQLMQAEPWKEFWDALGLDLLRFEDLGLTRTSSDREIWEICQREGLLLITDNRNHESPDSLDATIARLNQPDCLPVFTIADLDRFRTSRDYVDRVVESLLDYLLRIDEVRGAGRLYLP